MEGYFCEKCKKVMNPTNFYISNNLTKYPNEGRLNICKQCMTMHVNNWDPNTFLWILQEIDVPWIPNEWNKLMESYAKDPTKVTGTTIVGRYLAKMRLKNFKDFRWSDTQFCQDMAENKARQAMEMQGYAANAIAQQIAQIHVDMPTQAVRPPEPEVSTEQAAPQEDYFAQQSGAEEDTFDLTDEDRTYLRLKWGKAYKPEEWIQLEQLYNEMMESYDIQTAGHIDTLKLICKTSLKANQLVDLGD